MGKDQLEINSELDQIFRKSHGKIVSGLIAKFGVHQLESVESATMESYYKAMKVWPYRGMPENPIAWLYRTASNALIDDLRKTSRIVNLGEYESADEQDLKEEEMRDPELKLLFLICHPELKAEDQLAFMLKTLSGLGDHEISQALMLKKSTIKKRLQRARRSIAERDLKFEWPSSEDVPRRLVMVHRSLYLLFNEGFYSSHPDHLTRRDLCLESMRLCKYLADHPLGDGNTWALMSLMCYHISRYEARVDEHGEAILLHNQDRSKWDPYFIKVGDFYLEKSALANQAKSRYQIEALISGIHCRADTIEETDWKLLKELYQALYHLHADPPILLNQVVVHIFLKELDGARTIYQQLKKSDFNANPILYYMVGIELYDQMKDELKVQVLIDQALRSTLNERERRNINSKRKNFKS